MREGDRMWRGAAYDKRAERWNDPSRQVDVARAAACWALLLVLLFPVRTQSGWWLFESVSILDPFLVTALLVLIIACIARGSVYTGEHGVFGVLSLPVVFSLVSLSWSIEFMVTMKAVVVYGAALACYLISVNLLRGVSVDVLFKGAVIMVWFLSGTALLSYVPGSPLSPEAVYPQKVGDGTGFILSYRARFSHPFLGLSNSFGTILVMLLPFVLAARRLGVWPRRSFWTAAGIVAAIVATGSRGCLLALVVVFGLLWLYRMVSVGRVPRSVMSGGLVVVGLVAGFVLLSPEAMQHVEGRFKSRNIDARLEAYKTSIALVVEEYPLGIGGGVALEEIADGPLRRAVHNAYLQNVLWFGVVGGVPLSAAMLLLPWWVFGRSVETKEAEIVKRALATSLVLLMVVNLSQASWEGSLIRVWIYFIIGGGVAVIRQADRIPASSV